MKPKAATLQEKMGFRDPELSTPAHDEMVLWVIRNKAWVANFLQPETEVYVKPKKHNPASSFEWLTHTSFGDDSCIELTEGCRVKVKDEFKSEMDPEPFATVEVPIKDGSYIVGFVDVLITKRVAVAIYDEKSSLFHVEFKGPCGSPMAIEVKPKIQSFGETMRQVRHYQQYFSGPISIFTQDSRFKADFEEQKVRCFSKEDVARYAADKAATAA